MANIRATFSINAAGTVWGAIEGSLANQTDLANALNAKQNVITDLDTIRSNAENGNSAYQTIGTYGDIVTYNASDFATATQGGLADSALQPNDNITELTNNAGYITSASVGNGILTIQKNSTDVGTFSANQSTNKTINITVPTTASDVGALPDTTTINDLTSTEQQAALNSGATSTNIGQIATNTSAISTINGKIPSAASTTNQLADKQFVNNAIQTNSAHFRGNWATWSAVPTNSADYPADDDGNKTPTTNDYIVVEDASGYTEETLEGAWQFTYTGTWAANGKNGWLPRFQINESPLTPAQLAALNSGATTTNIGQITTNQNAIGTLCSLTTTAKTDLVSAINELDSDKQDNITDLSTIRSGAELGATSIQPGDNISELTNNAGYTTNVGTVTSVNNNLPDANGNVSIAIPTVNNATLTIQKNGTTVNTFTANASSNVTANITVPTDVSDLTNTTLANTDLGNLSEIGDNRLHALKAYSDNGEYLYDAEGLSDVKKYAHSTFDLSKFTEVGSPAITSDGVLTGTPDAYLTSTINGLSSATKYTISLEYTPSRVDTWGWIIYPDNHTGLGLLQESGIVHLCDVTNSTSFAKIANANLTLNTKTIFEITVDRTSYNFKATINGTEQSSSGTFTNAFTSNILWIGNYPGNGTIGYSKGSIDLRQFSITVDGVPGFSGNKTGIDMIKPDDYTVAGTPTISADGVAQSWTGVLATVPVVLSQLYNADSWEIQFKVYCANTSGSAYSSEVGIYLTSTQFPLVASICLDGAGMVHFFEGDNWAITSSAYSVGDWVNIKLTFDSQTGEYKLYTSANDNNLSLVNTYIPSRADKRIASLNDNNTNVRIDARDTSGATISNNGNLFDLNAFKIYVGGDLVSQPCLKIPYTLSKTCSKVVDSVYRPRVNDMYGQFGNAPYYTLSDTDFTLPQGELYGLIGQSTLRSYERNGINRKALYTNRTQWLTGSCTSGVEVTLSRPFSDANYMLSVPYSAKSATAFTPTQTGDWFAIGEGVL